MFPYPIINGTTLVPQAEVQVLPFDHFALQAYRVEETEDMATSTPKEPITQNPTPQEVLNALSDEFGDTLALTMFRLAKFESSLRQWNDDGTIVQSHTKDYGLMQIHAPIWQATADELELDYKNSWEDNIKLAKVIYLKQGITAWVTSKWL